MVPVYGYSASIRTPGQLNQGLNVYSYVCTYGTGTLKKKCAKSASLPNHDASRRERIFITFFK